MLSHTGPEGLNLRALQADFDPLYTYSASPSGQMLPSKTYCQAYSSLGERSSRWPFHDRITIWPLPDDENKTHTRYWLYNDKNRPFALEHALRLRAARANSRHRKLAMPAERISSSSPSSVFRSLRSNSLNFHT